MGSPAAYLQAKGLRPDVARRGGGLTATLSAISAAERFRPMPMKLQIPEARRASLRFTWKAPRLSDAQAEERRRQQAPAVLPPPRSLATVVGPDFRELRRLDIRMHASDGLLLEIASAQLPQLEVLTCSRSAQLTDHGVMSLVGGMGERPWGSVEVMRYLEGSKQAPGAPVPCPNLREIDLTFCPRTTYVMTVALRRLLPQLELIRRMPVWMTGENETPFAKRGEGMEIHKFYADGTFKFSRQGESRGFVAELQEGEAGVVREAYQYSDFHSEGDWPAFAEYCYRPGVAVRRDDGSSDHETQSPSIFVWEPCEGMRAPGRLSTKGVDSVPKGELVVVRRDGTKLPGADPDDDNPGCLVLSHMRVRPLSPGALMPPTDLVDSNIRYLLKNHDVTLDEKTVESQVHKEQDGLPEDDNSWRGGSVAALY